MTTHRSIGWVVALLATGAASVATAGTLIHDAGWFGDGAYDQAYLSSGPKLSAKYLQGHGWNYESPELAATLVDFGVAMGGGRVWISGGYDGASIVSDVRYATPSWGDPINSWTSATALPSPVRDHAMVAVDRFLFVLGGRVSGAPRDSIQVGELKYDSSLLGWKHANRQLPVALWNARAVSVGGWIYVIGGCTGAGENTAGTAVYFAKVEQDGDLGAWQTGPSLPEARTAHAVVSTQGRIWVLGGANAAGVDRATVWYSDITPTTGALSAWTATGSLGDPIRDHTVAIENGVMLCIGGRVAGMPVSDVYTTKLASDLGLGSWSVGFLLPVEVERAESFCIHGRIYQLGGRGLIGDYLRHTLYTNLDTDPAQAWAYKGRYTSRSVDLGKNTTVTDLSWSKTGTGAAGIRWRLAGDDGIFGDWSALASTSPAAVGAVGRYLQYRLEFSSDGTQPVEVTAVNATVQNVTYVRGNVSGSNTWTAANGPYVVHSQLNLVNGGTLTVQPGTRVLFAWPAGMYIENGFTLNANGAAGDSVYFSSLDGKSGHWKGAWWQSNSPSQLTYCVFERGGEPYNGYSQCFLANNATQPVMQRCVFRYSTGNGITTLSSSLNIDRSQAYGNAAAGAYLVGRASSGIPRVSQGIYRGNQDGVVIEGSSAANPSTVQLANIYGNARDGVRTLSSSTACLQSNQIHNNGRYPIYLDSASYPKNDCWTNNSFGGNGAEAIAFEGRVISSNFAFVDFGIAWRMLGDLNVYGGSMPTLTVPPGLRLEFAENAGIAVGAWGSYNPGQLSATGNAAQRITFTSASGQPGGWDGIYFGPSSAQGGAVQTLRFCDIDNAGQSGWGAPAAIQITQTPVRLAQLRVRNSSARGIHLSAVSDRIDSTSVSGCASYPLYLDGSAWLDVASVGYDFDGNTVDAVGFEGRNQGYAARLLDLGVPYRVLGDWQVYAYATNVPLTLDPGVALQFAAGTGLRIGNGGSYGGSLVAAGTLSKPITIGPAPSVTNWRGLWFDDASDGWGGVSTLDYCTVSGAGGSWGTVTADLWCTNTSQPSINHSVIRDGAQHGLFMTGSTIKVAATAFQGNGGYPIYLDGSSWLDPTSSGLSFSANGIQAVAMEGRNFGYDQVVIAPGVPYRVLGIINLYAYAAKPQLTLAPGVEMEFVGGSGLRIGNGGSYGGQLAAVGTSGAPIRFRAATGSSGFLGLRFDDASNLAGGVSTLDHVTISDASGAWDGVTSAVTSYSTDQPTILNSTIERGGKEGIYLASSSIRVVDTAINQCGEYPIYLDPGSWLALNSTGVTFSGNTIPAIGLAGREFGSDVTLQAMAVPYRVLGDLGLWQYGGKPAFTLHPGVQLEFAAGTGLRIANGGSYGAQLSALGTVDQPIRFRPAPGAAGWKGIFFDDASDLVGGASILRRCVIEGVNASWWSGVIADITSVNNQAVTLEESIVTGSSARGLSLHNAPITLTRSVVSGNHTEGIYSDGASFTLGGSAQSCNQLYGNDGYELRLGSNHNVNAAYNWWGSALESAIQAEIYDRSDLASLGVVTYAPWSSEACGDYPVPGPFHLLSPVNGSRVLTLTPTFDWGDAAGTGVTYTLELSHDSGFSSPIVINNIATSQYTLSSALEDGLLWYWRITARNNLSLSRRSEEVWSVTANVPPTAPVLLYPLDGTLCIPEWRLVWLQSVDPGNTAVTYRIQIDNDPNFGSPEIDQSGLTGDEQWKSNAVAITLGSLQGIGNLHGDTLYHWRVQGFDSYPDGSGWSLEPMSFYYMPIGAAGLEDESGLPRVTRLAQIRPNPSFGSMSVGFDLVNPSNVRLELFDLGGRLVREVVDRRYGAGRHRMLCDLRDDAGRRLPAGIYWLRFTAGTTHDARRVIVVQ